MSVTSTFPNGWQADWIGVPWVLDGRASSGVDCWGLIEQVWQAHAGVDLSPFRGATQVEEAGLRLGVCAEAALADPATARFTPLDQPRPGAIGLMTYRAKPVHAGLYATGGRFVHACQESGAVRQDDLHALEQTGRKILWFWPTEAGEATP